MAFAINIKCHGYGNDPVVTATNRKTETMITVSILLDYITLWSCANNGEAKKTSDTLFIMFVFAIKGSDALCKQHFIYLYNM